ncbi:MAG TPA: glucokinase [Thermoanaerobaculia bacterium]
MRVLAGDIGGTKTALAIATVDSSRLKIERSSTYPSAAFGSLEEIIARFLAGERRRPSVAAFGVAGPVVGGRARITKLPWSPEERAVSRAAGIPRVRLLNDFVAAALGLPYLSARQLATVSNGKPDPGGPMAILGAGTGLGQAGLWRSGTRVQPAPSEGGHVDFGPRNEREDRLVRFVRARFGRVDRDRLLSGGGLVLIYEFVKSEGEAPESRETAAAMEKEDPAAVIGRLALAGADPLSERALELFVEIYGSEAGNVALQYRATGGVYVGGGIATRILPALLTGSFRKAFLDKPPLEELLGRIPLKIVKERRLGLFGAAAAAYRTSIETTR